MRTDFDVIIIGAGPAGSSAAILLARAGWSVALIEKQRFPRRKVCGECIAASNMPLLEALGIGPAFEADAGPELRKVALMRGDNMIVADLPAANHEKYPWGRALGRETFDTLLLEQARLAGAEVLQPWVVETIDGKAGDWHCKVRAMDSAATLNLQAPVAIDAHGSWEALSSNRPRQSQAHKPSDLFAFKANFLNASLEDSLLPILLFDGGYGGMVVADGGATTVACCIRRDHLKEYRRASPERRAGDMIEAMLKRECDGVNAALHGAAREGSWIAVGPLNPGIRLSVDNDMFRIGNAVGEAHPIIGEGMSMALQSAWLLCVQLLNSKKDDKDWQREVGRRYTTQWRQQFVPRMRLAAMFAHLAMRPASAASLMALASIWPGLLTLGARLGGKIHSSADSAAFNFPGSVMAPAVVSSAISSENFAPLKADLTQIT
jgi:flavin-dependent dehydrogenase